MESRHQAISLFDRLRPLWIALTGSAFVGFAGGALTLMYFWRIEGVPLGQAVNLPALAKIVVATTLVLSGTLMALWTLPALLSRAFLDKEPFAHLMRRFFTRPSKRLADGGITSATWEVRLSGHDLAPSSNPPMELAGGRILTFALITVGSGCLGLILGALGPMAEPGGDWTWRTWLVCVAMPLCVALAGLLGLWRLFNRWADRTHGTVIENGHTSTASSALVSWVMLGVSAALVSLYPVALLMLVFLNTEFLLLHESMTTFVLGACAISAALVLTFSFSMAMLVDAERITRTSVRWALVVGVNFLVLSAVVMLLGLGGRLLERVMVMSSLRVERAVMVLEPEGCEILAAMQAVGWGRVPGATGKTCVLYDVTIQASLEPAMQIACWRGVVDPRDIPLPPGRAVQETGAASAPPGAVATSASGAASSASVPALTAPQHFNVGTRGSFSMPVKFVRSVRKTWGAQRMAAPVCPSEYLLPVSTPGAPSQVSVFDAQRDAVDVASLEPMSGPLLSIQRPLLPQSTGTPEPPTGTSRPAARAATDSP